jgi:hypothetical protein
MNRATRPGWPLGAGLLAVALIGGSVVAAQARHEAARADLAGFARIDACELVSADWLRGAFDSAVEARGGGGGSALWPHSLDWFVPRLATRTLAPVSMCAFGNERHDGPLGHLEVFLRREPTAPGRASLIVGKLFGPRLTTLELAGYAAWRTQDSSGFHVANAVLAGPYLVVVSAGAEGDVDSLLARVAGEAVATLEGD